MVYISVDKTEEVNKSNVEIPVRTTDHCRYFKRHPDTFLESKECWTCSYSDFGIETGNPSECGICKYKARKSIKLQKNIL